MGVWAGTLLVSDDPSANNAEGNWTFDLGNSDDRGGLWIDLNQDGIFQSDDGNLSNVAGLKGELINWDNGNAKTVSLAAGEYLIAFVHREGGGSENFSYSVATPNLSLELVNPASASQAGMWAVSESTDPANLGCLAAIPVAGECEEILERNYTVATGCGTSTVRQLVRYTINTGPPVITNLAAYTNYGCLGDQRVPGPIGLNVQLVELGSTANNGDVDTSAEAYEIFQFLDGNPGFTGSTGPLPNGITYDIANNLDELIDPGPINWDDGGNFTGDRSTTILGRGADDNHYLLRYTGTIVFPPGDYTIDHNADDGSLVRLEGVTLLNKYGENFDNDGSGGIIFGGTSPPDTTVYNGDSGGHHTGGSFSFTEETAVKVDMWFWEKGGGEHWEVSIANSLETGFGGAGTTFLLLEDGVFGLKFLSGKEIPPIYSLADATYGGAYEFEYTDPEGTNTVSGPYFMGESRVTNDCLVTVYRTWRVEDCCGDFDEALEIYSYSLTPEVMGATLKDLDLGCISSSNNIPPPDFIEAGTMASCGAVKISLSNQAAVGVGYMTTPNALMHYAYDDDDDNQLNFHNGGGLFNGGCFAQDGTFSGSTLFTDGPDGNGLDYGNGEFSPPAPGDNDNFMGVWAGTLFVSDDPSANNAEGNWTFDLGNSDDRGGLWIDLNQDGIFQSDDGNLSNVAGLKGELINWDNGTAKTVPLAAGEYLIAFVHREGGGSENFSYSVATPNLSLELVNPASPSQAGMWAVSESTDPANLGCLAAIPVAGECEEILERNYTVATGCGTSTVRQLVRYTINTAPPVITNLASYTNFGCEGDVRALVPNVPGINVSGYYGLDQDNDEINLPSLLDALVPDYTGGMLMEAFDYDQRRGLP